MILTLSQMIDNNIRHVEKDGDVYFDLAQVKEKCPHFKVEMSKVRKMEVQGETIPVVRYYDLEVMDDWDLHMLKTRKPPDK